MTKLMELSLAILQTGEYTCDFIDKTLLVCRIFDLVFFNISHAITSVEFSFFLGCCFSKLIISIHIFQDN